ncbi:MAG: YifB family Mg chelatase-like AAA ATPase [Bacteroidales bacterium]|nr:YifB family Mg chelatase-like AAA ATPase [Candidatus Cryptobacteroides equifaecalis]
MLIRINSAKCTGIDAEKVIVEVEIQMGIGIHLVGLADAAVKESLLRTTTALSSLGFKVPGKKIIINLAPADVHKKGSGYDLPIALGIIAASEQRELQALGDYMIMGELGLDGSVRAIPGALPYADLAAKEGMRGIILPEESALEAVEVPNIEVYGVKTLNDVLRIIGNPADCCDLLIWNTVAYNKIRRKRSLIHEESGIPDFRDIIGQEAAKRAAEIAAAGGHNLAMIGSPGSGKSSIAKAMAGILPPMTTEEAMVTSKIYSVAGKNNGRVGLVRERPFRSPHYSASMAAILGGGGGDSIQPGEITLACNGVLFLDELGQMPKSVIEALRAPLEDRKVSISRLRTKVDYPASFMLVAASNPCPCGFYGDGDRCNCTPTQRANYLSRLSGPIMDRIDLQVVVRQVPAEKIMHGCKAESSKDIAARVLKARIAQKNRFAAESINCNAEMDNKLLERYCPLDEACQETLKKIMGRMNLSMRAYFRIIKVARTIADLEESDRIKPKHLLEAASFRFLDKGDGITG